MQPILKGTKEKTEREIVRGVIVDVEEEQAQSIRGMMTVVHLNQCPETQHCLKIRGLQERIEDVDLKVDQKQ
jgi:hypothetical protein